MQKIFAASAIIALISFLSCNTSENQYNTVDVLQVSWSLEREKAFSKHDLVMLYTTKSEPDIVSMYSLNKPNEIAKNIGFKIREDSLYFSDWRMLCLFRGKKSVDTLFIDYSGHGEFMDKKFSIDSTLASLLGIKNFILNPAYKREFIRANK